MNMKAVLVILLGMLFSFASVSATADAAAPTTMAEGSSDMLLDDIDDGSVQQQALLEVEQKVAARAASLRGGLNLKGGARKSQYYKKAYNNGH